MDLQLGNRTALVTGASRGLGRAIAFKLAGEGVKMAIVARRGELLRELAAEITSAGAPQQSSKRTFLRLALLSRSLPRHCTISGASICSSTRRAAAARFHSKPRLNNGWKA